MKVIGSSSSGNKARTCEIRIAVACIEDLLRCEFEKGRLNQDIRLFQHYLSYLIDIAAHDNVVRDNLEEIILSANDMNVISDYFYLAAMILRLKVRKKLNLIMHKPLKLQKLRLKCLLYIV